LGILTVNKPPSAQMFTALHSYAAGETRLEDLPDIFQVMAKEFQKQEAEAYRSLRSVINYYPGIGEQTNE